MEFGVCIPNFGKHANKEAIAKVALRAEEEGYHSVWTTDHIIVPRKHSYPYGNLFETIVSLAYIAAITKDIRLGTSVVVLPQRDPILTAKQLATIDNLSSGRLIVGVGVGWLKEEFEYLKSEFRSRGRVCDEYIKLMKSLWRGDSSFKGRYYSLKGFVFSPTPARPGGPPIWIGGASPPAIRRAALMGDGWHPVGITPELYKKLVAEIRSIRGNDNFTKSIRLTVKLDGAGGTYKSPTGETRVMLGGRASDVIKQIEGYVEAGVEHFVVYFGDLRLEEYISKLKRFSSEVIPSF